MANLSGAPPAKGSADISTKISGAPKVTSDAELQRLRMSEQVPFAGLTVLSSKGVHADGQNYAVHDAGAVDPLDNSSIQIDFTLRNDSKSPLTLSRLLPSCHCTSAVVQVGAGAHADGKTLPVLEPGQQATVHTAVDLGGQPAGLLFKTVTVYIKNSTFPAAQLQIRANLLPIVSISPKLVDFGQIPTGASKAQTVTVSVDRRLITGGVFPNLVSTSERVQVSSPVALVDRSAAGFHTARMAMRSYQVTVPNDAALGPISGSLLLSPPARATAVQQTAFGSSSALLIGQISGDIIASPAVLAFGAVNYGRDQTRQIVLTGKSDDIWRGLTVAAASPSLTAAFDSSTPVFIDGQLQANNHVINVTLHGATAPGTLQTEIKVTLSNRQRLLIPVTAYISPTPLP